MQPAHLFQASPPNAVALRIKFPREALWRPCQIHSFPHRDTRFTSFSDTSFVHGIQQPPDPHSFSHQLKNTKSRVSCTSDMGETRGGFALMQTTSSCESEIQQVPCFPMQWGDGRHPSKREQEERRQEGQAPSKSNWASTTKP